MNRVLLAALLLAMLSCAQNAERTLADHEPEVPGAEEPASPSQPPDGGESQRPSQGDMGEEPEIRRRYGQMLYVPVYSHVYWGPDKRPFELACTVSVRNTDTRMSITLTSVEYYDTAGKLVRSYLSQPLRLSPLETRDFYLEERDTAGGSGANFIVRWQADSPANVPVVEAVMIGVHSSQGISFVCSAREIAE